MQGAKNVNPTIFMFINPSSYNCPLRLWPRLVVAAATPQQQAADLVTYQVTLENLTNGQPFSPPVAVTHSADVRMFHVDTAATDALAAIAQEGDPMPMVEALNDIATGVTAVVNVGRPLTPSGKTANIDGNEITDSATFTITAAPGDFLSLATMLICTNDGFTGLDSAVLPDGDAPVSYDLNGYDAGREQNTETSEDLVDPCTALGPNALNRNPNGNIDDAVASDPTEVIALHAGIQGGASLSVDAHGWSDPIATVTITRVDAASEDAIANGAAGDDATGDDATGDDALASEMATNAGLVTVQSNNSFDQTVQLLQQALRKQGLAIMGIIDHATNAQKANLTLPPTTLILVGNPKLGTPLMQSSRSIAIDLPQKFLVWQDENGDVFVTYNDPQYIAERHGITDQNEVLALITKALANFTAAATETTMTDESMMEESATYAVTVENLSTGQPFSPPVAATHAEDLHLFEEGQLASDALAAIAQDGDPMPMVDLLGETDGVSDVVNVGHPLMPAGKVAIVEDNDISDSAIFTITAAPGDRFSIATMLICTNDGFTGLDSVALPAEGETVYEADGYDAGREEDTELSTDLVDPCTALGSVALEGDPNGNIDDRVETDPVGRIQPHTGIVGAADLSTTEHGWSNPVLRVTITRLPDETRMNEAMTPSVTVADQAMADGTVTVAAAVSNGPGWIVIHADNNGAPGPVIGHSDLLTDGVNSDIVIEIDAAAATDTLYAMLHTDAGEAGTYEFPGPDAPVQVDGQAVTPTFTVTDDERGTTDGAIANPMDLFTETS